MRKVLQRFALLLFGLVFGFLIPEVLTRIFWQKRKVKTMNPQASKYHWDFDKTDRILRDFSQEEQIHFLSLLPTFNVAHNGTGRRLHFAYGGHMNEYGAVAGEAIADCLIRIGLVHQGR